MKGTVIYDNVTIVIQTNVHTCTGGERERECSVDTDKCQAYSLRVGYLSVYDGKTTV